MTTGYDPLYGRTKNSIVAVVPRCTLLLIHPVTTTCMDLPGGTAALDEQLINDLILWIKVLWKKRRLAFGYQWNVTHFMGWLIPENTAVYEKDS